MAVSDIGRAQANPTLGNILKVEGVEPVAGSVVTTTATGAPSLVTQANLSVGTAVNATNATSASYAQAVGLRVIHTKDVGSVGAGAVATFDVAVTGAAAGAPVMIGPPAGLDAGLIVTGLIPSADTVTVRVFNGTAAPIDPGSGVFAIVCLPLPSTVV